jgi:hypothetical protein
MVTTTEIIHFEAEPKKSPSESIPIDLEANLPPWRRQHKLRANPVEPAQVAKRSDDMATEEDMRQVYKTYRSLVEARQVALEEGPKAMETAGNVSVQVQEERTYQVHPLPPIPLPPKKNEVKQTLSISGSETESQGRAQLVRAQFWKTELCRFYPKCRKGDLCPFAHTDLEVKDRPNLTKTSLCAAWSKNCCPFLASECKFAHGSSQLRKTGLFSTAAEGRGKKEQLQKGGAAKVKKQQQRLAREKEFEIELGTPSDTSGGTPVLPSTPPEMQQFAVMPGQVAMMQASMMQASMMQAVAVVFVPVMSPVQSPTCNKEALERALQQAMPEYYED